MRKQTGMEPPDYAKTFVQQNQSYARCWEVLSPGRREQQQVWVSDIIIPKVIALLNVREEMKVLSVGAGNGEFDLMLLKEVMNSLETGEQPDKKIVYQVLEPNIELLRTFQENEELKNLSVVQFLWINKSFEDYTGGLHQDSENHKKFDFILFSDCLYYMNEEEVLKQSFLNLLTRNGLLMVTVGVDGDMWTKLRRRYENNVLSLRTEYHYPTEKSISKLVRSNGWHYETFIGEQNMEITEIFDEKSEVGNQILEFFFHQENPRETFDKDLLEDIMGFFSTAKESFVKIIDGRKRWYMRNNTGIVLIFKD